MRLLLLSLLPPILSAQVPQFEVASIRPSEARLTKRPVPCANGARATANPESDVVSAVAPLRSVIRDAYQGSVDDFDLPQWTVAFYAISVKMPLNTPVDTCRAMLRNLLADRFRMVTGVENRDVYRYFVRVAKSGLKLKSVDEPPAGHQTHTSTVTDGRVRIEFDAAPMRSILLYVGNQVVLNAPKRSPISIADLVDETGLTGYYTGVFRSSAMPGADPSVQTPEEASEEQLGLTWQLRKAPGKVLVIRSSAHTPTEN